MRRPRLITDSFVYACVLILFLFLKPNWAIVAPLVTFAGLVKLPDIIKGVANARTNRKH